jgi:hypothetical protein
MNEGSPWPQRDNGSTKAGSIWDRIIVDLHGSSGPELEARSTSIEDSRSGPARSGQVKSKHSTNHDGAGSKGSMEMGIGMALALVLARGVT